MTTAGSKESLRTSKLPVELVQVLRSAFLVAVFQHLKKNHTVDTFTFIGGVCVTSPHQK